ncbi:hypothetical protein SAMN05216326_12737 [Nitrosomonas marina]|uniref:Uncharacterized protein n=1 Tax=Nitrosomonas marina TaxID=917 RepID=A0A1I0EGR1_9PROT|nr:hypothetical protein [Nitrosomonas marina]SET44519.1 hypothetical protein SAMN05216326_12737 [Nitrosomonas marina]
MQLKRLYEPGTTEIVGIRLLSKPSRTQKITQQFIDEFTGYGLLSIGKGVVTIHAQGGDVNFNIISSPGYYCCFDGKRMAGEQAAKAYVADNFAGQTSPDPQNPAGYRRDSFYLCELMKGGE